MMESLCYALVVNSFAAKLPESRHNSQRSQSTTIFRVEVYPYRKMQKESRVKGSTAPLLFRPSTNDRPNMWTVRFRLHLVPPRPRKVVQSSSLSAIIASSKRPNTWLQIDLTWSHHYKSSYWTNAQLQNLHWSGGTKRDWFVGTYSVGYQRW